MDENRTSSLTNGGLMAKKKQRYSEWYLERERGKGKRFTPEQAKAIQEQFEGIYWHPDGKRYISVANVAYIDIEGKTKYKKPERTHATVTEARKWLEDQRSEGRKGLSTGIVQNPTLKQIINLTNPLKEIKSGWRIIKNYRNVIMEYFGEDRKLLAITEHDFLAFQSWLLARRCKHGFAQGKSKETENQRTLNPKTVNYYCQELSWLFKYARQKNMINMDFNFPMLETSSFRPFDIDLEDFLSCISHVPQHEAMLLMALNTGGRKMDVVTMTKGRVSSRLVKGENGEGFEKRTFITIQSTKTNKDNLQVPMLSELVDLLDKHIQSRDTMLQNWFDRLTNPSRKNHNQAVAQYQRALALLDQRRQKRDSVKYRYRLPIPTLPPIKQITCREDLNPEGYLFLNPKYLIPYRNVQFAIDSAIKKAGIKRFTMHIIRHLATTVLLDLTNGDLDLVQKVIGWSNQTMLQIYGHIGHRHIKTFANFDSLLERTRKGMKPEPKSENPEPSPQIRLLPSPIPEVEPHAPIAVNTAGA